MQTERTWSSHHSCKKSSFQSYRVVDRNGRWAIHHLDSEAHCSCKVTSYQPSPIVSVDNVEKERSCIFSSHATLHYFVVSLLATLPNSVEDERSVVHLRVSSRVDDCIDALLYISIFGDGGVGQTSINSTVKARAPMVYGIVLIYRWRRSDSSCQGNLQCWAWISGMSPTVILAAYFMSLGIDKDRFFSPFVVANQDVLLFLLMVCEFVGQDHVDDFSPIGPLREHHCESIDRCLPWSKVFPSNGWRHLLNLLENVILKVGFNCLGRNSWSWEFVCRIDAAAAAVGFCFPFVQSMPQLEPKLFDFGFAFTCVHQLITFQPAIWFLDPNVDHLVCSLLAMTEFSDRVVKPRHVDVHLVQSVPRTILRWEETEDDWVGISVWTFQGNAIVSIVLLFQFVSPLRAGASWHTRIWLKTLVSFCTTFWGLVLTRSEKFWNGKRHSTLFSTVSRCVGGESGATASGCWWCAMIWRR